MLTNLLKKSSRELHSQNNEVNDEIEIPKKRYLSPDKRKQIIDEYNNTIMEYQKVIHLLDNKSNQLPKLRTKNWITTNDKSKGVYNSNSDIRFKTTMVKSS